MTTFHPGDRVRVKSKEELLSGLMPSVLNGIDRSGFYSFERELWFAPPMFAFCGKEFTLKNPDGDNEHWWVFCESPDLTFHSGYYVFDEEWFDKVNESIDIGDIGGLL